MTDDPRRLFDAKDMAGAILYAQRISGGDAYPILVNPDGSLIVSLTSGTVSIDTAGLATSVGQTTHTTLLTEISGAVRGQLTIGTVTLSSTESTITNAVGNPVNVSLTNTAVTVAGTVSLTTTAVTASLSTTGVTVKNAVANPVNVSLTSTVVSVTLPPSLSTTAVTVTNAVGAPVNVSLTSTVVTVKSSVAGFNVNIATATLGTVTLSTTASTVTNSVSTLMLISKTLTGSTGSVSATWTSIFTPTTRAKIYAFSFTTTSATEVTVLVCDGTFANAKEKWRATLMAPSGANSGANLAVSPPGFLFASRSASAVTISLSTAVLVHYSLSYYDEA